MEISSQEDHEMAIPINSVFGGGHGHMIHHHHHDHAANAAAPPAQDSHNTTSPQVPSNGNNGHGNYEHRHDSNDHRHHHHHQLQQVGYNVISTKKQTVGVKYKECLKNHAAAMGGNATDGCGEFMPTGEEGSIEALICSACNCHRNFHRKEVEGEVVPFPHHHYQPPPPPPQPRKLMLTHHHRNNSNKIRSAVPHQMIMPYMSYMPTSESDDQMEEDDGSRGVAVAVASRPPPPYNHHLMKKRFRTKFTQEQKEKMLSFAEKVGWKIQRQEESVVQQFCQEIGVKRRVLKVWMHNNKHNHGKKNVDDDEVDNVNNLNMSGSHDNNAAENHLAS